MEPFGYIRENLLRLQETVARTAAAAGVPLPRLVAVTKSAGDDEVRYLVHNCGVTEIAENRTANFNARWALFDDGARPAMHLIGSLQTNKVKDVVGKAAMIQSVDRMHLAEEIDRQSAKRDVVSRVLLEINSGREPAKGGALPEEAEALLEGLLALSHLSVCGLMTMGPVTDDPALTRRCFRETAESFRRFREKGLLGDDAVLSMGMSSSYPIAVEEGATMIRVGRGLFVH